MTIWNLQHFDHITKEIIEKYKAIPAVDFLAANGYKNWTCHIVKFYGGIDEVRKQFKAGDLKNMKSMDGQSWLSFAEVCLANFLLARGVSIRKGKKYNSEYAVLSGNSYGIYDLHFDSDDDTEIKVEVWGGGRAGQSKKYNDTKAKKIAFHKNDPAFLGIDYKICYSELKLQNVLMPFIGHKPIKVENPFQVSSICISNVDQTVLKCKEIMTKLKTTSLPTQAWFLRNQNHSGRAILDWEPSSWSGFVSRLRSVGSDKIRDILKCSIRSSKRTTTEIVNDYKKIYLRHGKSPSAIEKCLRDKSKISKLSYEEMALLQVVYKLRVEAYSADFKEIMRQSGIPFNPRPNRRRTNT